MLDPIADKLIVSAALLMLAADQTIAGWSLIWFVLLGGFMIWLAWCRAKKQ